MQTTKAVPSPRYADLVDTLVATRIDLNITQTHLASILGVTSHTICAWERKRHNPGVEQFFAWCAALDVQVWGTARTGSSFIASLPLEYAKMRDHLSALAGPIEWDRHKRAYAQPVVAQSLWIARDTNSGAGNPYERAYTRGQP